MRIIDVSTDIALAVISPAATLTMFLKVSDLNRLFTMGILQLFLPDARNFSVFHQNYRMRFDIVK